MYKDQNGREVEITDTEFEAGEGCYVIDAVYVDNGERVDEATLEYIQEAYQSELYQDAYEHQASAAYDRYKDSYKYGEQYETVKIQYRPNTKTLVTCL